MRFKIIAGALIAIMVTAQSWGAVFPGGTYLTVGQQVFTTPPIVIGCYINSNSRCTMRKLDGTSSAGYQVTSGKTLIIYAIRAIPTANAGYVIAGIAQSDTDIGLDSASSFVNPIFGMSGNTTNVTFIVADSSSGSPQTEQAINFKVASGKYVGMQAAGAASWIAYGYEQ